VGKKWTGGGYKGDSPRPSKENLRRKMAVGENQGPTRDVNLQVLSKSEVKTVESIVGRREMGGSTCGGKIPKEGGGGIGGGGKGPGVSGMEQVKNRFKERKNAAPPEKGNWTVKGRGGNL